jgi:hypothetical protein
LEIALEEDVCWGHFTCAVPFAARALRHSVKARPLAFTCYTTCTLPAHCLFKASAVQF